MLALHWDDLDMEARTLRIDQSLVAVAKGASWGDAKNERSRRRIPLDDETLRVLKRRRAEQAIERLLAGAAWQNHDLIMATNRASSCCQDRTTARSRWRSSRPAFPAIAPTC
ncbi:hypothetical protein BH18ACT2_BH18ACT2_21350 [soil metagenome]